MFIICEGKVAEQPYVMPYTGKNVYTLEQLCYYLYQNIYSINIDFFNDTLAEWLEQEAGHEKLAGKIKDILADEPELKDLVVTLLCGCDYYQEAEIRKLVEVMDGIANLPLHQKRKIKADNYLRAGQYGKSLIEYRKLLNGGLAINFSTAEYGDILHNQGIAHFYTSSFHRAEMDFKEAYARNNNESSRNHFLWALLLQGKEDQFEEEVKFYGMSVQEAQAVRAKYTEAAMKPTGADFGKKKLREYQEELRQAFVY